MDQFYFEEGYIEQGYLVIIREAAANISSASSFVASVDIADTTGYYIPDYIEEGYFALPVQSADAALSSSATISITVTRIQPGDAVANAEFAQISNVGKILQGQADLGALFTPNIVAVASKNILAVIDTTTNLTSTISKFTGFEATLENIVNLSLQGARTRDADSALSSSFVQNADIARFRNVDSNLAISFTLTVVTGNLQSAQAALQSESTLTSGGGLLQTGASSIASIANILIRPISFIPKTLPYSRPNNLQEYVHLGPGNDWTVNTGNSFVSYTSVSNYFGLDGYIATIDQLIPSGADDASALVADLPTITINENEDFYIEIFYDPNFNLDNFQGETTVLSLGQNINSPLYSTVNFSEISMDGVINIGYSSVNPSTGESLRAKILKPDGTTLTLTIGTNIFGATRIVLRRIGSTITLWSQATGSTSATYSGRISSFNSIDTLSIYDAVGQRFSSNTDDPDIGRVVFKLGNGGPSSITASSDLDAVYNDENTVAYYEFNQNLNDTTNLFLEATANLNSNFTFTANPGNTLDATILQVSSGSLAADANVTRSASSTITSAASLTADAIKPVDFSATLNSEFTQTATAAANKVFASTQTSQATVSATAIRIKSFETEFSSIATQLTAFTRIGQGFITSEIATQLTASGDKTTGYSANLSANTTISSAILRIKSLSAQLAAQSTVVAAANRLGDLRAILETAASVSAATNTTRSATAGIASNATLDADVKIATKATGANLNTLATLSASANITKPGAANLSAAASVTAIGIIEVSASAGIAATSDLVVDYIRIKDLSTTFESIATGLIVVARIGAGFVTAEIIANLTVDASVTTGNVIVAESFATMTTQADRTRSSAFAGSAQFAFNADGTTSKDVNIALSSEFAQTTTAEKSVEASADLGSLFTPSIIALAQRGGEILSISTTALSAAGDRTRDLDSTILTVSTLDVDAIKAVNSDAQLQAQFTISANGKLIVILESQTYTVPTETRTHTIHRETRSYTIPRETRIYTIRG